MSRNQIIALAITGAVTAGLAATQFATVPTNLVWNKSADLPNTTPNDYTYEYRLQMPSSPNECYHVWAVQPIPGNPELPPNTGQIFRDGILMPGVGKFPQSFRCDIPANRLYVLGGDDLWYVWNIALQQWDQVNPAPSAITYPIYVIVNGVSCFDNGNSLGWDCAANFAPIEAAIPPGGGSIYFYLRAHYTDIISPDSAFLLLGVLSSPINPRLVPIG